MKRSASRWLVGICLGAIVHTAIYWALILVERPGLKGSAKRPEGAVFRYLGKDQVELSPIMQQQLELFDPKPLVQPTQWNLANSDDRFNRIEEFVGDDMDLFIDYLANYGDEKGVFVSAFGNSWRPAEDASKVFLGFSIDRTKGFGRRDRNLRSVEDESIELDIVRLNDGETVLDRYYNNEVAQQVRQLPGDWGSASFIVQILDSFQVGLPVTERGSGSPEADARLRLFVETEFIPKGELRDGFYLVQISR